MDALEQGIHIDTAAIPNTVRISLARGALALMEQVFSEPGAEERYQEWLAKRKEKAGEQSRRQKGVNNAN